MMKFIRACIIISMFFVPLVHSGVDIDWLNRINKWLYLPSWVSGVSSVFLFAIYFFSIFYSIYNRKLILEINYIPIVLIYFLLFVFSLVSFSDVLRYILLFLIIITYPVIIEVLMNDKGVKFIPLIIKAYILISLLFCIANFSFYRFNGMLGNPNIFAAVLLFQSFILLSFNKINEDKNIDLFLFIILILMIGSGSRSSILFYLSSYLFFIVKYRKKYLFFIIPVFIFSVHRIIILEPHYFDRVMELFEGVSAIAKSSGRSDFWYIVAQKILQKPYIGYGMNAPIDVVGSGNIHNSYLRLALMIGVPLTFFIMILLSISLLLSFINKNNCFFILLSFCMISFGEDFLVGIGSACLFFFLFSFHLENKINQNY